MTFQESIPIAKELAENELKKHFDADAFIILALVDKMNIDLVPESNVDETITDIQGLFVSYMRNRTKDNLEILLSTIRKMLSELYMSCNSDEKEIFKKHVKKRAPARAGSSSVFSVISSAALQALQTAPETASRRGSFRKGPFSQEPPAPPRGQRPPPFPQDRVKEHWPASSFAG